MVTGQKESSGNGGFSLSYDSQCLVCGAAAPGQPVGWVREHEYRTTTSLTFPVVRCPDCRLVYLYPRPDIAELATIYPPDYYSYHLSMNAPDRTGKRSFVQSLFYRQQRKTLAAKVLPFLKVHAHGRPLRILDVGCGIGSQLDSLKEMLPNSHTFGVEINELAVEKARARGHHVARGRFEEVELPEASFDLIISVHVIEHVARPDLFLHKCRQLLTEDGIILIETPNTDCLDFKLLKNKHWGGYHAPRHWYLFEAETFQHLAKRLNLKILQARSYTSSVFWNWTCHSLMTSVVGRKVADALFPPVTIFYGGIQSFMLLGFFAVLERTLLLLTGKASALWIIFSKGTEETTSDQESAFRVCDSDLREPCQ